MRDDPSGLHLARRACSATLVPLPLLAGCAPLAGDAGPWLAALAMLVLTALALATGALWSRLRAGPPAHDSRQPQRASSAPGSDLQWRTDNAGCLRHWRGPSGLPAPAIGQRLPDWFDSGADAELLGLALQRPEAFGPLALRRTAGAQDWLVAGAPCLDAAGRADGHAGYARPTTAAIAPALQRALFEAVADPLLLVARRAGNGPWTVLQANLEASRALDAPGDAGPALPDALRDALDAGAGALEAAGWRAAPFSDGALQGYALSRQSGREEANEQAAFSYTVSHDLRAPIRVVEGFARIVKEDYGAVLDRVANDHIDRVLGAAARMNLMIDAMLMLARLSSQPLARQPVNLSQLADFIVDDLRRTAPQRQVEVEIEPDLSVDGDPTLLRQVLENLIGNAWKYSAKRTPARIVVGRETRHGRAAYVVRDNGAGFDMRSAERLFGLFQRLHSANDFAGTGIGLASVKRIVKRHGGEVWADAEPGKGAAFYFTLGR